MIRLSANLGFLWNNLPLAEGIGRANAAGFDAVECHWPYDQNVQAVKAALRETGLPMLGLNTVKGGPGEFGLSALPDRELEAREAIASAFAYGRQIGARAVHVMAGVTADDGAADTFVRNLVHACELAAAERMMTLIEPINTRDVPGYFLTTVEQAAGIVERVGRPELKIMFDCYHQQIMGGDLLTRFQRHSAMIGHVQFAGVPRRAEPDKGEVAFGRLLPAITSAGYRGYFGAEYKPCAETEAGLQWIELFGRTVK